MEAKSYECQISSLYFGNDTYSCLWHRVPKVGCINNPSLKRADRWGHNIFIAKGTVKFLPAKLQYCIDNIMHALSSFSI